MVLRKISYLLACVAIATACKHQPAEVGNYPKEVGRILVSKCATSGCHNSRSYAGAGGLDMSTWDALFKGGNGGSSVIPYRPDFSTMCYYTNTFPELGVALTPTMPLDAAPLTKEEYTTIRDWIASGAPNAKGEVKFSGNPDRGKMYVTNRLCDVVTVFDAATLLQMRYIDVGVKSETEYPTCVKVAPDKQHWYVSFFAQSDVVQEYSAIDDRWTGNLVLGPGVWTSFVITADSKHAWFVDNSNPGKVVYADLEHNTVEASYTFNGQFRYPQGAVLNEALHKLYVGAANGNYIYAIDVSDPLQPLIAERPIDNKGVVLYQSIMDPNELLMVPGTNTCYIACAQSKELVAMDMRTDKSTGTIKLGTAPAFMSYSQYCDKLFVSCADDTMSFATNRGAIAIIDPATNTIVKRINTGYQPYGFAINDARQVAIVANANISARGTAPHHVSGCGGRNGNVTFIDLTTLTLIPGKRSEVAVYPYGVGVR